MKKWLERLCKKNTCALCPNPLGENPITIQYNAIDEVTMEDKLFEMKICVDCFGEENVREE